MTQRRTFLASHFTQLPQLFNSLPDPAYYAVGPHVTLAAITRTEVVDLARFNLVYRPQRVDCIVKMMKLSRLLQPLQEVIGYWTESEFVEIERHVQPFCAQWTQLMLLYRENGSIVTIGMACVQKKYTMPNRVSRIRHLRNIYDVLKRKNVPNVDNLNLAHDDDKRLGSAAFFSPRGINKPPTTGIEVTQAILCVLNALIV
jgi:hypothetical protein